MEGKWKVKGDVRRTRLTSKGKCGRETQKVPPGKIQHGFKGLDTGKGRNGGQSMCWTHTPTVSACGPLYIYIIVFLQEPPKV